MVVKTIVVRKSVAVRHAGSSPATGTKGINMIQNSLQEDTQTKRNYKELIGKTITGLSLGEDDALHFVFDDGSKFRIYDGGQSCCERRYMCTDDDLSEHIGKKLISMELKDGPDEKYEYGVHNVQFLEVKTSGGFFTMSNHNEHNGYYGGFWIQIERE